MNVQHTAWSRLLPLARVTLSEAKGLSRQAPRCFAPLSMTGLSTYRAVTLGIASATLLLHPQQLHLMTQSIRQTIL